MTKVRRRAVLSISPELLLSLLGIKGKVNILDARVDHFQSGQIDIVLEGPHLPECPEGSYPLPRNLEEL